MWRLTLAALKYSLACRRSSMRALSVEAKALFFTALTGKCWNWLSRIWPCTTTKRSTEATCCNKGSPVRESSRPLPHLPVCWSAGKHNQRCVEGSAVSGGAARVTFLEMKVVSASSAAVKRLMTSLKDSLDARFCDATWEGSVLRTRSLDL